MAITLGALGVIENGAEGDNWFPECNALFRAATAFAGGFLVLDKELTAPPGSESNGDAYIVGAGATGAWVGEDGNLARYSTHTSAYDFYPARAGMLVWVADENLAYIHNGTAWQPLNPQGATVAKTGAYTAAPADFAILCDATSAAFSITLPAAASHRGRMFFIKKTDASANAVTIDGDGAEEIDGATTYELDTQYEGALIICNGTGWHVVAHPGAEGTPTGDAGGDLDGTYPNPTITASVGLTGNPTAPTPAEADNDTSIATTAFVANAIAKQPEVLEYAISDETTDITAGVAKLTVRMPFAMTLTAVRASLSTASSSGTPTVDINEGGVSILSSKLTIDANEKTSTTAAVAAVISDPNLADDAEITFDIDVAGTGAKGLKVKLIGTRA